MAESKKTSSPPRIMIVDDESDILSVIKRGIESKNDFIVDTFSKADEAIENFQNHPPNYYDLVITDIRMPKVNGFELYRRIKETNPNMKIAFITAFEINKEEFSKDLSNAYLNGIKCNGTNLSNCNLQGANFAQSEIMDSNLENADLTDAIFLYGNLKK